MALYVKKRGRRKVKPAMMKMGKFLIILLFLLVIYTTTVFTIYCQPVGARYAVVYYGGLSSSVVDLIVNRGYKILICAVNNVPQRLKNAGVKCFKYLDILGLPIDMLDQVKNEHPEWILYTAEGKPATYWFGENFMCNLAVESFREYLVNKVKEYLKKDFDGVFLDDVVKDPRSLGPPLYDTPMYNETMYGRWMDALKALFSEIKEAGALIIYNAGWSEPDDELMEIADGVLLESHPGSWSGTLSNPKYYYRDWSWILAISTKAQAFAEKGKIVIALSYGGNDNAAYYTYAATRLFDFYYWFATPDLVKIVDSPVLKLDIGDPIGSYNTVDGVFYRVYSKGVVVLNPYPNSKKVKLSVISAWTGLKDQHGNTYKVENGEVEIEIAGRSGLLLTPAEVEEVFTSILVYMPAYLVLGIAVAVPLIIFLLVLRALRRAK